MSERQFNIRLAGLLDVPALMLMIPDYLHEVEKLEITEAQRDEIRLKVLKGIIVDDVTVLIVEKKKGKRFQEIGYGVFDLRPNIFGQVMAWGHHLYIKPEYRNQDLAQRMVESAEKLAQEAGAKEFFIDTAHPKLFEAKLGYSYKYTVVSKQLGGEKNVE